ncbi:hypothetical protein HT031_004378 [Scenedesmus sp. PABB004]|nr:hypothetical protein HT031_004378 [Scenedesmus sp. PABB004]
MQDPSTHRELVAAVASLKSCLRSVLLALAPAPGGAPGANNSPPAGGAPPGAPDRLAGALARAGQAAAALRRLLAAVSDQSLRLPLETSKRLVEVELPDLLASLLGVAGPGCAWPAPAPAGGGGAAAGPGAGAPLPALRHPAWPDVSGLIAEVFGVLHLLCDVAVRACRRSADPVMVLLQLASPRVVEACVAHMHALWAAHVGEQAAAAPADAGAAVDAGAPAAPGGAAPPARRACEAFGGAVSAFSGVYAVLAAAVDAQAGLGELEAVLAGGLSASGFLPAAVQLLLAAAAAPGGEHDLAVHCQAGGWDLLTLALFLSGGDIATCPAGPSSADVRAGQHIPSSVLAAHIRQAEDAPRAAGKPPGAAAAAAASASLAASEAACGLPLGAMTAQLLAPPVLLFLEERLHHAVREMRGLCAGAPGGSSGALAALGRPGSPAEAADSGGEVLPLLPGRCVPDDQDVLAAALRTLRVWRALLLGPAGPALPLVSGRGLGLLLALLRGALAESIKDGSAERQALRGRLVRVAVHCLQLVCGYVAPGTLRDALPDLTSALAGVVGAAGAFWDAHRRLIKSADLSFTGQVRCVDKATGDMLVRYSMAAASALLVLGQLLAACGAEPGGAAAAAGVMLDAGLLPPVEQLFRQVPVVSAAHVAAADLLVQLLPAGSAHAGLGAGQLPLLATLRKFTVRAAGVAEPDREAAHAATARLATLLGRLACAADAGAVVAPCAPQCVLLQHTAAQLLPALQAHAAAMLRAPLTGAVGLAPSGALTSLAALSLSPSAGAAGQGPCCHLFSVLLETYARLACVAARAPALGLTQQLLAAQAPATAAAIVGSSFWAHPAVAAAAALPRNAGLTPAAVGGSVVTLLEALVAAPGAAPAGSGTATPLLHSSCSDDCLLAIQRQGGGQCPLGNLQCGLDGCSCCCSPKATSEPSPGRPAGVSSPGGLGAAPVLAPPPQAGAPQQQLVLLSALLQSRLLPEAHRLLAALPAGGVALPQAASGALRGESPRGGGAGAFSSGSAAVAIPPRLGSGAAQLSARDRVSGTSPTYSILTTLAASSARQQAARLGGGARRASDGLAAGGGSPPAVDGDVGGLLRGGSWGSFHGAWLAAGSASGTGDARQSLARQSSSGFSSSAASLGSLAAALSEAAAALPAGSRGPSLSQQQGLDAALALALRLQAVLLAVGQRALELAGVGALGAAEGRASASLSTASSGEAPARQGSWSGAMGSAPPALLLHGRSTSGSVGSLHSLPGQDSEVVLAALRAALAGARGGAVALSAGGSASEPLFSVDLAPLEAPAPGGAPAPSGGGGGAGEPAAVLEGLRGLVGSVQAAAPLLARSAAGADSQPCTHAALARLAPRPVGCWNAGCVVMAGASEAAAPAKPCPNCGVAVFCSKGCEKAAWSGHTLACAKLAAAAAVAAAAAAPGAH